MICLSRSDSDILFVGVLIQMQLIDIDFMRKYENEADVD
jgi:hypothetical protein